MQAAPLLNLVLCIFLAVNAAGKSVRLQDTAPLPKAAITARQASIVSFNLSNIGVLLALKGFLFLKAIILTPKGINERFAKRTADTAELTTNPALSIDSWEMDAAKEFMRSFESGEVTCLQRLACENPERAEDYLMAGGTLLHGARLLNLIKNFGPLYRYEFIEQAMTEASQKARRESLLDEDSCESNYPCERFH